MNKIFSAYTNKNSNVDSIIQAFVEGGKTLTEQYTAKRTKESTYKNKNTQLLFSDVKTDTYIEDNKKYMESLMKYCVENSKCGFAWTGMDTLKNSMVTNHPQFKSTFNAVVSQVLTPVVPAIVSTTYMDLAEIQQVGYGETGRFIIKPNDTFLVTDSAEGVQFGGLQRLYNDEITVNPQPKNIRFDVPWYQVAAGLFDFGEWAYKIGVSFGGYINALVVQSFTSVISGLASPYKASGFSDSQYVTIGQTVKAGNANSDVYVYGTLTTLSKVIPTQAGLQYGLGEEWSKVGYLDKYKGFRLMEIDQALVPSTVNTTANLIIPNDTLYFIPMNSYKPVKVVFEGANIVVESIATETPDKTGGLSITMRLGVAAALGSKFGAITNIS